MTRKERRTILSLWHKGYPCRMLAMLWGVTSLDIQNIIRASVRKVRVKI